MEVPLVLPSSSDEQFLVTWHQTNDASRKTQAGLAFASLDH